MQVYFIIYIYYLYIFIFIIKQNRKELKNV